MISNFKNKKTGAVIEWDSRQGTLMVSVWEPYTVPEANRVERTKLKHDPKAVAEARKKGIEEFEKFKLEDKLAKEKEEKEAKAPNKVVEVEEEIDSLQTFSSVKLLQENADPRFDAITKAGVIYTHNGTKWVKK